jgi:hypothetical protein
MIFLFGANALALSVAAELEKVGEDHQILIDEEYFSVDIYGGIKVSVSNKINFLSEDRVINCLGYHDLYARQSVASRYKKLGKLDSYVSPRAIIGLNSQIGMGSVILGDSFVERGSIIGEGCILWHKSHVCHDAEIGPFSFLAAGSIVGGYSKIPCYSKLGFNSVIQENSDFSAADSLNPGALAFVRRNGSIARS